MCNAFVKPVRSMIKVLTNKAHSYAAVHMPNITVLKHDDVADCRIQMLDAVRYMVVWNPIVLLGLHFAIHVLGVDKKQQLLHEHSQQLHALHMNSTYMNSTQLNSTQPWNASAADMLSNLTSTLSQS